MIIRDGEIFNRWLNAAEVELAEPVRFVIPEIDAIVTVRAGFRYDGASVPRFFWRAIGAPYDGAYFPAALLHDALYASELLPRTMCDRLFLAYMKQLGVAWWRRNAMWLAVRWFGGAVWATHTGAQIAEARARITLSR